LTDSVKCYVSANKMAIRVHLNNFFFLIKKKKKKTKGFHPLWPGVAARPPPVVRGGGAPPLRVWGHRVATPSAQGWPAATPR
jgi:hypothetical protein